MEDYNKKELELKTVRSSIRKAFMEYQKEASTTYRTSMEKAAEELKKQLAIRQKLRVLLQNQATEAKCTLIRIRANGTPANVCDAEMDYLKEKTRIEIDLSNLKNDTELDRINYKEAVRAAKDEYDASIRAARTDMSNSLDAVNEEFMAFADEYRRQKAECEEENEILEKIL